MGVGVGVGVVGGGGYVGGFWVGHDWWRFRKGVEGQVEDSDLEDMRSYVRDKVYQPPNVV